MDGSVTIGVILDTSAFATSVSQLESRLSALSHEISTALVPTPPEGISEKVLSYLSGITSAVNTASGNINSAMRSAANSAISTFTGAGWSSAGSAAGTALSGSFSGGASAIVGAARSVASSAAGAFSSGSWSSVGSSMMSGVATGILSAGREIISAIQRVSAETESAVKGYFKIQSPSALMRDEVGVMISRGIAEGILDGRGQIRAAMDAVYPVIPHTATQSVSQRTLNQSIYLRDSDQSPYLTAKRIKKESEAALGR